jgi:hypothetical protein
MRSLNREILNYLKSVKLSSSIACDLYVSLLTLSIFVMIETVKINFQN